MLGCDELPPSVQTSLAKRGEPDGGQFELAPSSRPGSSPGDAGRVQLIAPDRVDKVRRAAMSGAKGRGNEAPSPWLARRSPFNQNRPIRLVHIYDTRVCTKGYLSS